MSIPIPLPNGCSGLSGSPKKKSIVKNLFKTIGESPVFALRPGVTSIADDRGACRGLGIFRNGDTGNEEVVGVYGNDLLRITIVNDRVQKEVRPTDVSIEVLGSIPGLGVCEIVGGFSKLCIIEVGTFGYVYDETDGLEQITDPDFIAAASVDYDAGRFVFVPADGSPFYWSKLDNPASIDPQNFADAERFTDPNKYVKFFNDSIVIGGTRSHQRFNYDPTLDTYITFQGEGSTIGYVGGLTDYGESFAFIGLGNDGGFNMYVYGPTGPALISNDFIAEFLNQNYSLIEIERATANTIEWKGTTLTFFDLPRHTLCFYGSGWCFVQSGITGSQIDKWQINHIQQAYGYFWTGDNKRGSIGMLMDNGLEYGEEIESGFQFNVRGTENTQVSVRFVYAEVTMGTSQQDREPRISLQTSEDGRIFSYPDYQTLGKTGHYNDGVRWGGDEPVGRFNGGATMLLLSYGDVAINYDGVSYA